MINPCGWIERTNTAWSRALQFGNVQTVDEPALTAQQRRVFAPDGAGVMCVGHRLILPRRE